MKITKKSSRTYEVTFFPDSWKMIHSVFIEGRKRMGLSTNKLDHCFCCGKILPLDKSPTFITVNNGVGNRFACEECTAQEVNHE